MRRRVLPRRPVLCSDLVLLVSVSPPVCRSCIVQYLQASSFCPTCEVQLHKGSPLRSLKPDKTLQDIVYKLVPNLFHNEMRRRRVYYDTHPQYADQTTPEQRGDCLERFYSPDDSVSLSLEYHDRRPSSTSSSSPPADGQKSLPPKRYLKCPALFTIGLLKKFIRLKFDLPQELVIDIFQRRESLADEYTLLDIAYIYPWKTSEPMKFFYRVRDPRVPESDEEVEREMPSLSAAVGGRATRASRRASSASSLASPLGSPRGSPVPSGKRSRPDMEEKECDKQDPTPPPARLTAQPPTGAAVHPKPVAVKPVPSPTSPGPTGPKITLTISPSRGTVTSTTTEPATPKSPPPAAPALKPATAAPTPTPTPAPAPVKKNGAATPAAVKNGTVTPKTPSFAATVTTKTANGGFVTVKNPIARPLNGVTVGSKTPASPQHVPASPKMTPILPKPAQGVPKAKRLTNGLPLLAPKGDVRAAPAPPSNMALPAAEAASRRTTTPVTASNARPSAPSAPAPKPAASPAPAASQATEAPSAAQKQEEEKKTMETAKAILQLSMGFKQSRSDTPTDSTLHNHIDKIVKDLDDDESNDGTLVIKSEPSSPASSGARSPVPSPNPQPPTATPATLPPSLPKVNGLTITPIEPSKRKATSSPALEEKRPRMEQATAGKRPAEGPPPSPAAPKQAKVDKIADLIKRKQEQERLHSQQERDKKAATQQPQAGGQTNALRPVGNPSQAAKPALNSTKPSSPLTKQPLSSPTTLKSFPPAQMKPIAPKPPGIPANAQGKPVSQAAAAMPGQPSASMAAKAAPAAPPSTQHQTKPAAAAAAARPTSAPQSHQDKLSQQTAGKPTSAPKPSSAPQAQGQQQQQAKSTAAPPARSPSGAQGLQQLQQAQQAKTAASQHGAARQVQQSKPAPAQPGPQAKAAAAPQQGQPSKPAPAQPAKQVSFGAAREQDNGAKMAMEARKRATPSPQQSPQQSAVKVSTASL
ncbi:hypothetical protein ONE63_001844 [Megalurothrips usitatus]|uniref:RAWUL domain-containing protein n=1 Tax=Megalurothrips usitatus TaxID=439358 RepID=A0AAV7X9L0_9NEOP|nr:hypothetical protein ONE63_001844 [Megalurothrips usitatus]